MSWEDDQRFEREWWGTCVNTFGEETKQITYAHRMGLVNQPIGEHWPAYDLEGKSVVDIGGGPVSMLLKCLNMGRGLVIDPCQYPSWTQGRYLFSRIEVRRIEAESFVRESQEFDEAWIYNCLQHTRNPEQIITNARSVAKLVRLFEWIDIPPCPGHPQELKAEKLDAWLGGRGTIEFMRENGCYGRAYYGIFTGF